MPIILVLLQGSHKGREKKFDQEVVRLGRKADNDLVFSENMVSSYHAEIRRKGGSYALADLDSTNGTFLNGAQVQKETLQDGDQIELGKKGPVLEFRAGTSATQGEVPRIVPMSGSWEGGDGAIELREGKVALGRGLKNDIVVGRAHGSPVSSEHAEIRVRAGGCEIEDLGSTNGTFVNGQQIRATSLKHGDRV